jgi:hypothetical protein
MKKLKLSVETGQVQVVIGSALDLSSRTILWLAIVGVLICVNGFAWVGGFNA